MIYFGFFLEFSRASDFQAGEFPPLQRGKTLKLLKQGQVCCIIAKLFRLTGKLKKTIGYNGIIKQRDSPKKFGRKPQI